jgi:Virulence protein RhuM family
MTTSTKHTADGEGVEVVEFRSTDGLVSLRARLCDRDIWLTQEQIAELFNAERSNVTKHLRKAAQDGEIASDSWRDESSHQPDGQRRRVRLYNLDAILIVGMRIKSARAREFRIWARNVLRIVLTGQVSNAALQALEARLLDEQRAARDEQREILAQMQLGIEAWHKEAVRERSYSSTYNPVHGRLAARSWNELRSTMERTAQLEAEIEVLRGATDKRKALRSAHSSIVNEVKTVSGYGWVPGQKLREMPADREWSVCESLRERERRARERLAALQSARQQQIDFGNN